MFSASKSFLIKLIVITTILLGVGLLLFSTILTAYAFPAFPFLIIYFFSITFLTHSILVKYADIRFARFSTIYMLITGVKLFVNIIFLVIYIWLYTKTAFPFIICFLITYITYTVFEVVSLLAHFKEKNQPPSIIVH
jgi:hypothetical protein